MKVMLALYVLNIVLGAVLYLDVVRTRRSGWWLIGFFVLMYPALLAYVISSRGMPWHRKGSGSV